MTLRLILGATLALFILPVRAEDYLATLKVGKEVYTGVTVTSVTATDVYFSHNGGLGNAKLKDLAPELKTRFRFNPGRAKERQQQQAEGNAIYTKHLKDAGDSAREGLTPEDPADDIDQLRPRGMGLHGAKHSFLNQPTPSIEIEKWLTKKPDLAGKFVLVDFWATWCGPCRQSIPHLNELSRKFAGRLVVIGLSDESEVAVRKMASPKIDFSIAIDTQHRTLRTAGVRNIPHALLIDPSGIVRFEGHPDSLDEKPLEMLMAKHPA